MSLKALILLTLLSRTPHHKDSESWESREARMELVASGVDASVAMATCTETEDSAPIPDGCKPIWGGTQKSLAMLLVTQAVSETHLSHRIHDNECDTWECDSRRVWNKETKAYDFVQQSFSLWQIKHFADIPPAHWAMIEKGRAGTKYAAWAATRRLASGLTACGSIEGTIARYTTGGSCQWVKAPARFEIYEGLMSADPEKLVAAKLRHEEEIRSLPAEVASN